MASGGDEHLVELEKMVSDNDELVQRIALEGVLQVDEVKRNVMLKRIVQNSSGNIQEQTQMNILLDIDDVSKVEWNRQKIEFLLSKENISNKRKCCEILVSQLGVFEEEFENRIIRSLESMQGSALSAIKINFTASEDKKHKLRMIELLSKIKSRKSAMILLDLYGDKDYDKDILKAVIALDPLSSAVLTMSDLPKDKIALT